MMPGVVETRSATIFWDKSARSLKTGRAAMRPGDTVDTGNLIRLIDRQRKRYRGR